MSAEGVKAKSAPQSPSEHASRILDCDRHVRKSMGNREGGPGQAKPRDTSSLSQVDRHRSQHIFRLLATDARKQEVLDLR